MGRFVPSVGVFTWCLISHGMGLIMKYGFTLDICVICCFSVIP